MRELKDVPMSEVAEKAVVACCIWEPRVVPLVFEICSVTDFAVFEMKLFAQAIYDVWRADVAVDLVTVEQKITDDEKCDSDLLYLWKTIIDESTINVLPSAANAEYYAKIIKEKRYERDLIRAINKISEEVYDKSINIREKKELFDQAVLSLNLDEGIKDQSVAAIAQRIWDARIAEDEGNSLFVPTGYERIDEQIGGFGPGEYAIVATRPSNGKTTMLMEMAMSMSTRVPVLFLSMEMSQESVVLRVLSHMTRLPILKLKCGDLSPDQELRYEQAKNDIGRYQIYVDEQAMLSPAAVAAKILKAKAQYGIGCVMLDYLQLMHIPKWRSDNRVAEMTRISNEVRAAAKQARVPIVVASQMSRSIESRADGEPRLSDLRESGAIEQDADYVFFLYPYAEDVAQKGYEQFLPGPNESRQHCLKIAKCRQGPRDIKINLYWCPAYYTFKSNVNKEQDACKAKATEDIPF